MGRRGKADPPGFDGVLVIDKPAGMTSHDVVAKVRKAGGLRRVGHTGTLDPDATGVLVVCLSRATRLVELLQTGHKVYTATVRFGVETDSQDASGETVAEADASGITREAVLEAFAPLVGDILQIPPMVSAIKIDGERLHEKARRGEVVERPPRPVTVHAITVDDFRPGPRAEADITVTCGGGTYVRTLGHDAGQALGVGAHLSALRRTANGPFTLDEAVSLDEVMKAGEERRVRDLLMSPGDAVSYLDEVEVDQAAAAKIANGAMLPPRGVPGPCRVTWDGRLLAVYVDEGRRMKPQVVLVQPEEIAAAAGA